VAEKQRESGSEGQPLGIVPLVGCRCRCGHEWLPRDAERPRVCPKCKSPNWDRPKLWTGKRPKAD
jgi:predicted Zn-ribbon and HTH transcriptional regulator